MKVDELKKIAEECDYKYEEDGILHKLRDTFYGHYILIDKLNKGGIKIMNDRCSEEDFRMIKGAVDFSNTPLDERGYPKKPWDSIELTEKEKEIIDRYERYNSSGFRPRIFFNLSQEESDELMKLKKLIIEYSKNAEKIILCDANSDEECLGRKVIISTSIKDIEKLRETAGYPENTILGGLDEVSLKKQKRQIEECILYNEEEIEEELLEIDGEKVKGKNLILYVADRVLDIFRLEIKINKHL